MLEYFGARLRTIRKEKNKTQSEVATLLGVSEQAVSKWETGECLPDVYNLKMLAKLLHVSVDTLLEDEEENREKVVEVIHIGDAVFEVVEKQETIYAGKFFYAEDFSNINEFLSYVDSYPREAESHVNDMVYEGVFPNSDTHVSINFWREEKMRGYGFARETTSINQPEGIDIFVNPASLYIRAYPDTHISHLVAKEKCQLWELFAYIRNFLMPNHGFVMADNGAQEIEIFDNEEHSTGYVYMPVKRA